jgi:hypothetical protein
MFRPLPLAAIGFRPEFLDFERGIRVGNLEENERITRILKLGLEARHGQPFVTERYGRGVFWQWIGLLPRENRAVKPISSHVSFGCSKFFISLDRGTQLFKCGMQVERGMVKASPEAAQFQLQADWDWHRLLASLKAKSPMEKELRRLVLKEGFALEGGWWDDGLTGFSKSNFPDMKKLHTLLRRAKPDCWAGFQVYYPMKKEEVMGSNGADLVESMLAIFDEVVPVMNLCMQIQL